MKIETLPIEKLKVATYNPRRISKQALEGLRRSMGEFGLVDPLIVNERTGYTVVGGHQRLTVLKDSGATEVDCVIVDLEPEREKALNIALNNPSAQGTFEEKMLKELLAEIRSSGKDPKITGFSEAEITKLIGNPEGEKDPDDIPEPPKEAVSQTGDIWECGQHRVMCGDSTSKEDLEVMMVDKRGTCVFTDPPYGVGYTGKGGASIEGDITETAVPLFFSFLDLMLAAKGWLYVCAGYSQLSTIERLFVRYLRCMSRPIIWDKCRTVIRHNGYHSAYEAIYVGYREGGGAIWHGPRNGEAATDVWRVLLEETRAHLTQKPVELPKRAIVNSTRTGEIVVDPFLGSGSTLIAAEQTSRRCFGMEIEPRYVDVAVKRWQEYTGKKAKNIIRPDVTIT